GRNAAQVEASRRGGVLVDVELCHQHGGRGTVSISAGQCLRRVSLPASRSLTSGRRSRSLVKDPMKRLTRTEVRAERLLRASRSIAVLGARRDDAVVEFLKQEG